MAKKVAAFATTLTTLFLTRGMAVAGDFFIITKTFDSQTQAQDRAAETGGWVLDTDAYTALETKRFAVVRGPFATSIAATAELASLTAGSRNQDAYVQDAGSPRMPAITPEGVPSALVAALLGEISIEIHEHPGGSNLCEPQEPYQRVTLSYAGLTRRYDEATDEYPIVPSRVPIEIGEFFILKQTGEIERMRGCFE